MLMDSQIRQYCRYPPNLGDQSQDDFFQPATTLSYDTSKTSTANQSLKRFVNSPLASKLDFSLSLPSSAETPFPSQSLRNSYMQSTFNNDSDNSNFTSRASSSLPGSEAQPYSDEAIDDRFSTNHWNQPAQHSQHLLSPSDVIQRHRKPAQIAGHKRNSSGSTIASTGPSSPFTPISSLPTHLLESDAQTYNTSVDLDSSYNFGHYQKSPSNGQNLQFADTFLLPQYNTYATPRQQHHADPQVQSHIGARHFMAQPPAELSNTLQKTPSGDFLDEFKNSMDNRNGVPKLDRTMSDIYQDELYNPNVTLSTATPQPSQTAPTGKDSHLSPRRDVFSERLQAANNGHMSARSGSPADSLSRERSPFRPTSEYVNDEIPAAHTSPSGLRLGSAAQMRERQKAEADARAFARHHQQASIQNTRTISPKEALLDVRDPEEESMSPLFNSEEAPTRHDGQTNSFTTLDNEPGSSVGLSSSQNSYTEAIGDGAATGKPSSKQSNRQRNTPQVPQQYPFISQPRRQNSGVQSTPDSVPEFPANLTSMESTRSESRSSEPASDSSEVRRPLNTTADSGTYSCTYHGCAMRFETPAKLQRHKRDGHRQGTPPVATSSDLLASRNTQAGPHKCERINPSTGKPCNSIFSRPYDLTRHEDTIHNARKQKVKCQLCTEDKTFSRNDALTRHMRVVHPEVDFPGKVKRKG